MPRHPDFEKIYQAFMWRYCRDKGECEEGKSVYYAWLNKMSLDDTKPYMRPQERYSWVSQSALQLFKEDEEAKYFKVDALFPITSMNLNVYTRDELVKACRTLIRRPVNLNHTAKILPEIDIVDADYEDDGVECILKVPRNSETLPLIEKGDIVHVSIEADCIRGLDFAGNANVCKGLVFTGLALLTKDVLPGVPLTKIEPIEKVVEGFAVSSVNEMSEKAEEKEKEAPTEKLDPPENKDSAKPTEGTEPSPCEKATEALLVRVEGLEREIEELKKSKEAIALEPQTQPSPPEILTKEGFWARFHQLRSEGLSKSDAFRLVSLELLETVNKQSR